MRPIIVEWLARHGLPGWLAPDYASAAGSAALLGAILVLRLAERDGARVHVQARALLIAYAAALLGGYVFEWMRAIPIAVASWSIDPILRAGRAAYGGLIFGVLCPALWLRWRRERIADFLDRATIGMGIAYGAVRVGCFLEGCDYGRPTSSIVGVRFPSGSLAAEAHAAAGFVPGGAPSLPVHPTELFESALGLVATGVSLLFLRGGRRDGTSFAAWLAAYAGGRFSIELLRGDADRGIYLGLSTAQWVSLAILGGIVIVRCRVRHPRVARVVGLAAFVWLVSAPRAAHAQLLPPPPLPPSQPPPSAALPPASPPPVAAPAPGQIVVVQQGPANLAPGTPYLPARPDAPPSRPRTERDFEIRGALVTAQTIARPDVPSGAAGELDAMARLRASARLRIQLGLEGRVFANTVARHYSLGLVGELDVELSRIVDLTFVVVPHHTWFDFDSAFYTSTNAYGLRYATGVQFTLGDRYVLGGTPLAFTTTSAHTIGVITQWEPRLTFGVTF